MVATTRLLDGLDNCRTEAMWPPVFPPPQPPRARLRPDSANGYDPPLDGLRLARYFLGSKKIAWMAVLPMFSVACSSASRHWDAPAGSSISAVSPDGIVNRTLPPSPSR